MIGLDVFTWSLAVFPVCFVYWWSMRPLFRERLAEREPSADAVIARYRWRTVLLTVVPIASFAAALPLLGETLPAGVKSWFPALVFHLAWWGGVFPLVQRGGPREPGLPGDGAPSAPAAGIREASLAAREEREFLPTWWWTAPVGIFLGGLAMIGWRVSDGAVEGAAGVGLAIAMPLGALSFLLGYGWWARHIANGPQDLSGAVDPELLSRAYDDFRRFLVRGIFWVMTAAVLLFMGAAVAVLFADGPAAAGRAGGLLGGIGGALVGVAGGVLGTAASLRRMKLDRIRRHGAAEPIVPPRRAPSP